MNTEKLNNDMFGNKPNNLGRLIVIILLALLLAIVAVNVASALHDFSGNPSQEETNYFRSESCRTFPLYAHQKGNDVTEEIDYHLCNEPTIREVIISTVIPSHKERDNQLDVTPQENQQVENEPQEEPQEEVPSDSTNTNDNPPANDPPKDDKPAKIHPNSGRGNGSEIDPATGKDIDPGNSGGHNKGGD